MRKISVIKLLLVASVAFAFGVALGPTIMPMITTPTIMPMITTVKHFNPHCEYIGTETKELWLVEYPDGFRALSGKPVKSDDFETLISLRPDAKDLINRLREGKSMEVKCSHFATLYHHRFGIAGRWNYSLIQTTDFKQRLIEIVGSQAWNPPPGTRSEPLPWIAIGMTSPFTNKGFRDFVEITMLRELTPAEIEAICRLIEEYLY